MKRRFVLLAAGALLLAITIIRPSPRPSTPTPSRPIAAVPQEPLREEPAASLPAPVVERAPAAPGVEPWTPPPDLKVPDPAEVRKKAPARPKPVLPETNEVLITLHPGADPQEFARDHGLELKFSLVGADGIHVFAAATPAAAKAARARALRDPRVARAFMNERTQHIHCAFVPNDTYYPNGVPSASFHGQWHLGNGASPNHSNAVGAWNRDFTGAGVLLGIVDDCLQTAHPDLSPNYVAADSWNFGNSTGDPNPNPAYDGTPNEDRHGTSVSGVAAARGGNGAGTTGAAPFASLAGLRVDFPAQTTAMFVNATLYHSSGGNTNIKIKNHSYGISATYIDAIAESQAVTDSASAGTVHLFAAGNERGTVAEDSNKTQPQNNPDAIAVAALGSDGKFAYYSSFGANVFVTAPSSGISGFGITTTDRIGNRGYNTNAGSGDGDAFPDLSYTSAFGGTSSATPLMSGILALGKQARPGLDVRFAKHALARSCTQNDPTDGTATGGGSGVAGSGTAWKTNAAGFKFNQNYGFGLVNADLFVQKLQQFSGVTPQTTESVGPVTVGATIPDAPASPPAPAGTPGTPVSRTFTLASTTPLEEMLVTFDITHPYRGDLEAYLTSPSGTTRRLFRSVNDNGDNILWTFVTNEFWGENPAGTWTLVVQDWGPVDVGTWNSFAVTARMGTVIADTTPPTVTSITRASANPTSAASVTFTATFSEPVTGVDASDFVLTTTGTLSGVSIGSVTGTNRVYTVVVNTGSGDGTLRLDVADDDSIQDAMTNSLGGAGAGNGNFAAGELYTIDRTASTVTDVSSTALNGAYKAGGSLPVTVTFSEPVTVTGTPQLRLATGGAGSLVNYSSGTGTAVLTFTYVVASGHNSPDLDCTTTGALTLNGGTIKDAAGNNATLTLPAPGAAGSLGANKDLVVDTTLPGAPGTPSGSPNPNNGSFSVTWTAASDGAGSGIASYTVQRSDNLGPFNTIASGLAVLSLAQNGLAGGGYRYQVLALDVAGNQGPFSAVSPSVTVDTTPPAAPSVPDLAAASDSGFSSTDNLTNLTALTFNGTAEAGSTVQIFVDGVGGATTTAVGGNWTLLVPTLTAGVHSITARATDTVGNLGPLSGALSVTVDLTLPVSSTPDLAPASDSGASNSDDLTNLTTLTFIGTAEAGSSVQIYVDGVPGPTGIAAGGNWSIVASGLAPGVRVITARATDAAGNLGPAAGSLSVTIDTTAPLASSTPDLAPASDSGSSSGDNLTKLTTLSFSGTAEAGAGVQLFIDGVGGASSTALGGNWTLVAAGVAEGVHSVTAVVTDLAGNAGPVSGALSVTVDTTPSTVPVITSVANDTGPNASDGVTNDNQLTISGTAEVGITVQFIVDGVPGATTTAVGGAWSFNTATLADGIHTLAVLSRDLAGNDSATASRTMTIDTVAPAAPSIPDLDAASDSGNSSDNLTNLTTLSFSGTAEAGATVQLFVDGVPSSTGVATGGAWTIVVGPLAPGVRLISARATDLAGNNSPTTTALSVTIDTTPPAAPSIPDLDPASDTGNNSDNITSLTTLSFSGTAEAGSSVQLFVDGAPGATTTAAGGAWTLIAASLSTGTHSITARATDAAGNLGPLSGPLSVTVDNAPPAASSAPDLVAASDSGTSSSDNITSVLNPTFVVNGEAGATLSFFRNGIAAGSAADSGGGVYSITFDATAFANTTVVFTARLTDAAGNVGPLSPGLSVTFDTSAPAAPSVPDLAAGSDSGTSSSDNITNLTTLTFNGSAEAGASVQLFIDGVGGATTIAAGGNWTIVAAAMTAGPHSITARASDAAGNLGPLSGPLAVTIDTTAPAAPSTPDLDPASDTGNNSDNITSLTTLSFSGTAEAGASVQLFVDGVGVATALAVGGNWTIVASPVAPGVHSITARATDLAGNVGPLSGALSVTVDNAPPAAPSAPDLVAASDSGASNSDNITSNLSPTFSITGEAGGTITLFRNGVSAGTAADSGGGVYSIVFDATAFANASVSFTATLTDAAGNTSPLSPALSVTFDTTLPAAPSTPDLAPGSDSGTSNSDNLTSVATPTFTGTAEAGSSVQLFIDGVGGPSTTAVGGNWTLVAPALSGGVHSITARATDVAGNLGPASGGLSVTIDLTAPAAPSAPDLVAASDSGSSSSDNVTSVLNPTFVVNGEAGATLSFFRDGIAAGSAPDSGGGVYSITFDATAFANTTVVFTARLTDAAGNVGPLSPGLSVTFDTSAPAPPSVPDLAAGSDSGTSSSDNITNLTTLTFNGSAEAGASVQLFIDGVGGATTIAAGGNWTIVAAAMTAGPHSITARASDAAGNLGPLSGPLAVTIDTTPPAAPSVPDLVAASDTGVSSTDNITSILTPTFQVSGEAGGLAQLFADGVLIASASESSPGNYLITVASGVADGSTVVFTAKIVDAAGNTSPFSASGLSVQFDATPPALPSIPDLAAGSDSGTSSTDNLTNLTTLTFTGTAEAGSTVQLLVDAVPGATTTAVGGNWTIVATLAAGTHAVAARSSDLAGSTSAPSGALSVTVDLTPPPAPSIPDLDPASDSGNPTDNVTNLLTLSFSGSAEAGATVQLFVDGVGGATTVAAAGTWTIVATVTAGVRSITARATDAAGNVGPVSGALSVTVDTTPPAAPSAPDLDAASDSGNPTDNITNLTTLSFSGSAEAGATVQIFVDGGGGATTVAAGGAWTIVAASVSPGVHSITARATDVAGNPGPLSAPLSVTVDTTLPLTPSVPDLDPASDTGTSSTDNLTSIVTPSFSGTAEAGALVKLFAGAVQVGSVTAGAGGNWTIVSSALADGTYSFTATATDGAGNVSGASAGLSVMIDATPPAAPSAPDLDAASDTGASGTDNRTKSTTLSFSGTAEPNSTVQLFVNGVAGATVVAAAGTGAWTLTAGPVAEGTLDITARARDTAGNLGAVSGTLQVIVDTTAPAAPSIPDLDAASDSGNPTDNITNLTTLSFSGTAEASGTVQLFIDGIAGPSVAANGAGAWTIVASPVAPGVHSITARVTDLAGNLGPASAPLTVTVDTTPPPAPSVPDLDAASDSGISNTDNLTKLTTLSFSGTAEAGATVQILIDGVPGPTGTANGAGNWTIVAGPLAAGVRAVAARSSDAAGNVSTDSAPLPVTIDTTAPAAPSAPDLSAADDSGASNSDNITKQTTLTFSGSAEAGAQVQLLVDGITGATTTAAGGAWTLAAGPLAEGVHAITAVATDPAGNAGPASAPLAVTVDLTAPPAPSAPDLDAASDSGTSSSDNLTKLTTLSFSGTAEAGSTVRLLVDGTPVALATIAGSSWTLTAAGVAEGVHLVTATATDAAGNLGPASAPLSVTADLTPPPAPSTPDLDPASDLGSSNTDNLTSLTTLLFNGTAEAGSTVQLFVDGAPGATVVAAGGAWTLTAASLSSGPHALTARATDAAGNLGPVSGTLTVTIDSSAPPAPSVPDLDAASDSGISNTDNLTKLTSLSFSGTAETGATVRLFVDGVSAGTAAAVGGAWTIIASPVPAGPHTITATALDSAGNVSPASGGLVVTVDNVPPPTPAAPVLDAAADSGASSTDAITTIHLLSFSGTTEAGATVRLYTGVTEVGNGVAGPGGGYTVGSSLLPDGAYDITVTATDAAGNVSAASASFTVIIDNSPPPAGLVQDGPGADIDFQNSGTTIKANWSGFVDPLSGILKYEVAIGTTPGGAELEAFVDVGTATSVTRGPFALVEGATCFVTVRATNPLNLTSTATSDGVKVDTIPPAPPGGLLAIPGDASATLYWTASPSSDTAFYRAWWKLPAAAWSSATLVDNLPGLSAVIPGLANGTLTDFRLVAVDAAGNESTDLFASATPQPAIQIQGGGTFATIQAAIDAATPGQTILIGPGTYVGDLVLHPGVSLQGWAPGFTLLQGTGLGPVVTVEGTFGTGLSSTISQLTVTGGLTGISALSADLTVQNAVIHHVLGNGLFVGSAGRLELLNGTLMSNTGDGVRSLGATTLRNTISGSNGGFGFNVPGAASVTYSDAFGNTAGDFSAGAGGTGNLTSTALFMNEAAFDYRTTALSPTADAGDPADDFSQEPVPNGGRIDMGAFGGTRWAVTTTAGSPPPVVASGGGGGGGGGCGLTGLDAVGLLALLALLKRRK